MTVRDTSTSPSGGVRGHAARPFDGDPGDVPLRRHVALAGVQAECPGAAEAVTRGGERPRAGDRARRTIERREKFPWREREPAAAEPSDLLPDVRLEGGVTRCAGPVAVDARPQHRRQHAVGRLLLPGGGEEGADAIEDRILIADERQMIVTGQLDELGPRHQPGDVAPLVDQQAAVAGCGAAPGSAPARAAARSARRSARSSG